MELRLGLGFAFGCGCGCGFGLGLGRAFRRAARHDQLNVARPQRDWFAVVTFERLVVVANKPHLVPPGVFITRAEVLDAPATHAVVLLA